MSLLSDMTQTVVLRVPTATGEDALGEPLVTWEEVALGGCLVAVGAQSGPTAERPQLLHDRRTVYLATGQDLDLKLCELVISGRRYHVMGDPVPYPHSPVGWDTVVEVEASDG